MKIPPKIFEKFRSRSFFSNLLGCSLAPLLTVRMHIEQGLTNAAICHLHVSTENGCCDDRLRLTCDLCTQPPTAHRRMLSAERHIRRHISETAIFPLRLVMTARLINGAVNFTAADRRCSSRKRRSCRLADAVTADQINGAR